MFSKKEKSLIAKDHVFSNNRFSGTHSKEFMIAVELKKIKFNRSGCGVLIKNVKLVSFVKIKNRLKAGWILL